MCFSSFASFASSAILIILGLLGLLINYKCKECYIYLRGNPSDNLLLKIKQDSIYWWPFLITPLLFGIQQLSEGFVWIYLNKDIDPNPPGYCFSFFAFCFWPVWVPFICLILSLSHQNYILHSILFLFFLCGFGFFLYMLISLIINGLSISSLHSHIVYHFSPLSHHSPFSITIPYLLCTILPFVFLPNVSHSWLFSLTVGISAILSYIFFKEQSFPSTWCFFAAWLSLQAIALRIYNIYFTYHLMKLQFETSSQQQQHNHNQSSQTQSSPYPTNQPQKEGSSFSSSNMDKLENISLDS